ncbi:MAG: FHA domain-containing protein [Verrucomicrobia bacterium]|nr:MAG: FHA domain-containing protein [Verrucomicrobiota bacterium]
MAQLIGMSEEVKGKTFLIDQDEMVIGRRKENNIVLDHASVSGRHCAIRREGGRCFVRDLGSTNGTRLNGRDLNVEQRLHPKDLLQVGTLELIYDSDEPADIEAADLPHTTQIEISTGPTGKPASFGSISPFGTRQKNTAAVWWIIIGVIGILALVTAVVLFVYVLNLK